VITSLEWRSRKALTLPYCISPWSPSAAPSGRAIAAG
jgi:hypothetical protein